jgi:hypothetical protein
MVGKDSSEQERYERASKHVEELKSFYTHLGVYIVVNVGLFLINIMTSPRGLWFYWVLIGWGIGLLIHAFNVFISERVMGPDWEERKIREIMEKERK